MCIVAAEDKHKKQGINDKFIGHSAAATLDASSVYRTSAERNSELRRFGKAN